MKIIFFVVACGIGLFFASCASLHKSGKQEKQKSDTAIVKFDDTRSAVWDPAIALVEIESPIDQKKQKAYFYKSTAAKPQPLLVSLHTWSGNYAQQDSIAELAKANDYNYIHPDFRGANNKVEACGSALALSDIDASIDYAIKHGNVDPKQIYVIGVSGGGYATLNVFMHSKHQIRKFSAWASITDLVAWYNECTAKGLKYAHDVFVCTASEGDELNIAEAEKRSPLYASTPVAKLRQSQLSIFAGVHDGITGSVPFTHSIHLYNKILEDLKVADKSYYVSSAEIDRLLASRKSLGDFGKIGTREICLTKQYGNVRLVIFDGGHEMLTDYAYGDLFNK